MDRDGDRKAGLELLGRARAEDLLVPTVVYLQHLDLALGKPADAVAITNRPDELLDHVVTVLVHARGGPRSGG